jgi:hypothetical protein
MISTGRKTLDNHEATADMFGLDAHRARRVRVLAPLKSQALPTPTPRLYEPSSGCRDGLPSGRLAGWSSRCPRNTLIQITFTMFIGWGKAAGSHDDIEVRLAFKL